MAVTGLRLHCLSSTGRHLVVTWASPQRQDHSRALPSRHSLQFGPPLITHTGRGGTQRGERLPESPREAEPGPGTEARALRLSQGPLFPGCVWDPGREAWGMWGPASLGPRAQPGRAALCQRGCPPWPGETLPCGPQPTSEPAGTPARGSPSLLTSRPRDQAPPCPEAPLAQTPAWPPRVPLSKRKGAPAPSSGSSQNRQLTVPPRLPAWHPTGPGACGHRCCCPSAAPRPGPGREAGGVLHDPQSPGRAGRQPGASRVFLRRACGRGPRGGAPTLCRGQGPDSSPSGPPRSAPNLPFCDLSPDWLLCLCDCPPANPERPEPPPLHPPNSGQRSGPFGITPIFLKCPLRCPPPAGLSTGPPPPQALCPHTLSPSRWPDRPWAEAELPGHRPL